MTKYSRHFEETSRVAAEPEQIFAFADDHHNFVSHMATSSWVMGGGKMETRFDEGNGQRVGSHIKMSGNAFGARLTLDEVATERTPPHRKTWETVGDPRLLVIGPYRLGFTITPTDPGSDVKVFIDYAPPSSFPSRLLGSLACGAYAKWCVRQMLGGVRERFQQTTKPRVPVTS